MTKTARRPDSRDLIDDLSGVIVSWPDSAAREWTVSTVDRARTDISIVVIVATGSSVREVKSSDDLDLVLVYRRDQPGLPRAPISIDLRMYEESSVHQMLSAGHDYLSWAVRFGVPLFERDGWWAALVRDWDERLCLPSEAEARERARKAERLYCDLCEVGDEDAAAEQHLSMLTHLSRAELTSARVFPRSRPELPKQLQEIDQIELASRLEDALEQRRARTA